MEFQLFPEQASSIAREVDALYGFLVGISLFFATLIVVLVVGFAVKYRRRSEEERPAAIHGNLGLEVVWTVIPLCLVLTAFAWGASVYYKIFRPPADAMDIYTVGKQWMWKFYHPAGRQEINELHVPVGRPIRMIMASEDVIHSFYVPAFRVKMDVLPGRYTMVWFEATKSGRYHLFCAEYCGTAHSGMVGQVVAMDPVRYQEWLSGGVAGETLESAGARLFTQLGCESCHRQVSGARGPALEGLFGSRVSLKSGETIVADESYVRESILDPNARIVSGYQSIMPTFKGLISEEGLLQIIAYIRSLGTSQTAEAP